MFPFQSEIISVLARLADNPDVGRLRLLNSFDVKGLLRLVGYIAYATVIALATVACTQTQPQLEDLNSLSPISFQGKDSATLTITNLIDKVSFTADCSQFTEGIDLSYDNGVTWDENSTQSTVSKSNDCKSQSKYSMVFDPSSSHFGFTKGVVGSKTVLLRAKTSLSDTSSFKLLFIYQPTNTTLARLTSNSGVVEGSNFKLKYRVGFGTPSSIKGSKFEIRTRTQ